MMLRSNNLHNSMMSNEYYNIHQMAVAGDVLEDFTIIFRDMMAMVCKNYIFYKTICNC